ncbi:MAG: hypothetical protein WAT93_13415, partial [Pontixanthobacter sp.]
MDRVEAKLREGIDDVDNVGTSVIGLGAGDEHVLDDAASLARIPDELLSLDELDVFYQEDTQALWT